MDQQTKTGTDLGLLKVITLTVITILFLMCRQNGSCQTTHLIRGVDFAYLPDTAYLNEGDSIHFDPITGLHNMTQTGFSDWLNNIAITNGGFDTVIGADTTFVIDTAGTYYFVCLPHGYVGMKGVLIVAPLTTAIQPGSIGSFEFGPNPTPGILNISSSYTDVEIYDLFGRSHGIWTGRTIDLTDLENGSYIIKAKVGSAFISRRLQKISN